MSDVPSNLIPTRITQLPVAPVADEDSLMMIVYEGNNYQIRVGDLLAVAGVPTDRQVIAGTALTGGGQLTSNVTLSVASKAIDGALLENTGVTPGVYGSDVNTPVFTVDPTGRIMAATTVPSSAAAAAAASAAAAAASAGAAAGSASAASSSADDAATSAAAALVSENNSAASADASAASAASAAAIVNISSVTTFTNPLARAVQVSITAATSASNGIQQLTNVQNNFGTGNFALQWRGSVPDWTPAATLLLIWKFVTVGYVVSVRSSGLVRIQINGTVYESTVATGLADNAVAVLDIDVTRESPTAAGSVVFTLNGVQLGAAVAITAGVPATVDNAGSLYICGDSSARTASQWFSHRLFNRAKTVAENLSMFVNGVAAADVGGSQTNFFTGDSSNFEGGTTGGWAINTGNGATSVAVNTVAPISGTYDLKITTNGLVNSGGYITIGSIVLGEKYRLVFDYKGAASNAWNIIFRNNANPSSGSVWANTVTGGTGWQPATAGQLVYEFTASLTTASARIHIVNSVVDSLQIDNCLFVNLGMTSELLAQNAQTDTGQVLDSSGNQQHALLPVAGATVLPQPYNFQVRWANTWAGTSELQYLAGVNQAILSANAVIDEVLAEISGTAVDGTLGDGVDADRYATIAGNTGLITGTNFLALAAKTTDGTNRKLTWTPSAAFTGTIKFTVRGYVRD